MAGRIVTVLLFVCSSATVYLLDSAKDAFDIILQIGAGTGLLYLVRWFWWRVNAWCEIVAMISSFAVSLALLRPGQATASTFSTHVALLTTIAVTTVCWLADGVSRRRRPIARCLIRFYRKVRPFGPGWADDSARGRAAGRRRRRRPTTFRWRCSAGSPAARRSGPVAFRGRQLPLRRDRRVVSVLRRVRGQRPRADCDCPETLVERRRRGERQRA